MGKVGSKVARVMIQRYNVQNRAERVVNKAEAFKPIPAPKHATTVEDLRKLQEEHPEWLEAQKTKYDGLHDRLKGLVVNPEKFGELNIKRSLPESREVIEDNEFGYPEPSNIRPGRFTIKQSINFISRHKANPSIYTASDVAAEYNIDLVAATEVLEYFQTFKVHIPKKLREKLDKDNALTVPQVNELDSGNFKKH